MPETDKEKIIDNLILIGYNRRNATDIFQRYEKLNKLDCLFLRVEKCKEEILNGVSNI